jgi:hypothetical protein
VREGWDQLQERVARARFSLGRRVRYTPPGGPAQTISAVYMRRASVRPDGDLYENTHVVEARERFQLRRSEVLKPVIGATLVSENLTYVIEAIDQDHTSETDITVIVKRSYA